MDALTAALWEQGEAIFRLIAAAALGGMVGLERERSGKPAGFRTHLLICVGARFDEPEDGREGEVGPEHFRDGGGRLLPVRLRELEVGDGEPNRLSLPADLEIPPFGGLRIRSILRR